MKLEQIAEINPMTRIEKGSQAPFIQLPDLPLYERKILNFSLREYKGSGTKFQNGDTLVARINPSLANGKGALVSGLPENSYGFGSTEFIVLRAKNKSDEKFVYYFTRSELFREIAISNMEGAVQQRVPHHIISNIVIPNFSKKRRKKIGQILSNIDEKIEINYEITRSLKRIVKKVFRDWFVDFGPVHAKVKGQEPYLRSEIWSVFPDDFEESGNPKNWKMSTVGEEACVVGGSTPKTTRKEYWNGKINWTTPKDLSTLRDPVILDTSRTITETGLMRIASGLLPPGTVILSSRAPIGYMAISEIPISINQGIIGIVCEKQLSNVFMSQWIIENIENIKSWANGSTFLEINKKDFRNIPMLIPSEEALAAFDSIAIPLHEYVVAANYEAKALSRMRDLVLSGLMSGRMNVSEFSEDSVGDDV